MTEIKMMMLAVLALALAMALPALAQDTTQPSTQANPSTGQQQPDQSGSQPMQQPEMSQPAPTQPNQGTGSAVSGTNPQAPQGAQILSGTISADGKTFNSNGNSYVISNPNSVKPFAGQPVSVGYETDANNSIHISKVMLSHPQQ
jgi:hypothetical protein